MAKDELNSTVTAQDAHNEATEAAKPIRLTFMGEEWTLDFNRRAIQRIYDNPALLSALAVNPDDNPVLLLGRWAFTMPQIISIASGMKLTLAEKVFDAMGGKKPDFAVRVAGLFINRVAALMGQGNEDVTEPDAGNVSWE